MIRKGQIWIFSGERGIPRVLMFRLVEERGGFWQPITGKVESGESFEQGALRELKEETGFNVMPEHLLDLDHRFQFTGRWGVAEEAAYAVELSSELTPVLEAREHTAAEWVSLEEAEKRLPFENQKEALQKLRKLLRARGILS